LLAPDPPAAPDPPDSFSYDPRFPTPSIGGIRFNPYNNNVIVGPRDQRDSVEARSDVVIYTTAVLADPLVIAGAVSARLFVSSDRPDTDFGIRLTDVYPDGRSMLVTEGVRRMRFRNSFSLEELMTPGDTYAVNIETRNLAYTFLPGHRVRLIVGSSDYPVFHANLNNGDSLYVSGDTLTAANKVYHEPGALSALYFRTRAAGGISERGADLKGPGRPGRICCGVFILDFFLERESDVSLSIFDAAGRRILFHDRKFARPGPQRLTVDLSAFPSGVYFACLDVGGRPAMTAKIVNLSE
jgi:hypothetical protein